MVNSFYGGLDLDSAAWQSLAADTSAIVKMPAPTTLEIPLSDKFGQCAQPVVAAGDQVLAGQPLTRLDDQQCPPVLASCAGVVKAVDSINPSLLATGQTVPGITINVDRDNSDAPYQAITGGDTQQLVHHSGIRGLGGAAFPAAHKWHSVEKPVGTLIINAAECEPLISCDEALMCTQPVALVEAIDQLSRHLAAARCLVGIEADKVLALEQLRSARQAQNLESFTLVPIPPKYPAGAERQLIKILTGREVPHGRRPAEIGIRCFNVATTLALAQVLTHQRAPTRRVVTVTGTAIKQPVNVSVKFGTPLADLVNFVEPDLPEPVEFMLGGPLSGIKHEALTGSVSAATNCVQVNHPQASHRGPAPVVQPCIRCGQCDQVCPQQLLPQQLHWYCQSQNLPQARRFNLDACIECGCCDQVCPSSIPLTQQFRDSKQAELSQQRASLLARHDKSRFEQRKLRLLRREAARQQRLAQRKAELNARRQSQRHQSPRHQGPSADAVAAAIARGRKRKNDNPDPS